MAGKKFSAQVDDFVRETEKRMNALARASVQQVIDQAQTPVAKGGKMRVDTGFLRASGQMSYTGMPSGPVRPAKDGKYEFVEVNLADFKVGSTLYFGWSANYAKYREAYDGFLASAVQNWPAIVASVCAQIKGRSSAS